jgi:hypothetical protein
MWHLFPLQIPEITDYSKEIDVVNRLEYAVAIFEAVPVFT